MGKGSHLHVCSQSVRRRFTTTVVTAVDTLVTAYYYHTQDHKVAQSHKYNGARRKQTPCNRRNILTGYRKFPPTNSWILQDMCRQQRSLKCHRSSPKDRPHPTFSTQQPQTVCCRPPCAEPATPCAPIYPHLPTPHFPLHSTPLCTTPATRQDDPAPSFSHGKIVLHTVRKDACLCACIVTELLQCCVQWYIYLQAGLLCCSCSSRTASCNQASEEQKYMWACLQCPERLPALCKVDRSRGCWRRV